MTGGQLTIGGVPQPSCKQGLPVLLKHRNKLAATAAVILMAVALYVPLHLFFLASPSLKAALQKGLETTAVIAGVHANKSTAASQQHSPSTPNNSAVHHHYHYHCSNTSSQPGVSASPSPLPTGKPSCLHQANADQPTEHEIKALLGHQLRPLPSTDSNSSVLSTSNWEGLASEEHAGDQRMECSNCFRNKHHTPLISHPIPT
jgi:hypothetical protein